MRMIDDGIVSELKRISPSPESSIRSTQMNCRYVMKEYRDDKPLSPKSDGSEL